MDKIRILLVDDSAVVRRLVSAALHQDAELEVVGTAANGRIALSRLSDLRPDLILLDLEMPEMDGLQTLAAIRQVQPRLPVIMFSRFTQRGVEATVHALTLGANDYVPKPGDGVEVNACIEQQLIPKIKLLARSTAAATPHPAPQPAPHPAATIAARSPSISLPRLPRRVEVVVIAASTGGPNALAELLPTLPAEWSVPLLIVQHMPPMFTARLAERLTDKSRLRVREAVAGEPIVAAQGWVAPGDYHMVLEREGKTIRLGLHQEAPVNSCRPAADVLFQSAAEVYGAGVLAVVLTGMGQDGKRGCESIRTAGGQVLAQDEATSIVWGMPGAVAQAGLADRVLPLSQIGPEIIRRVQLIGLSHGGTDQRGCN